MSRFVLAALVLSLPLAACDSSAAPAEDAGGAATADAPADAPAAAPDGPGVDVPTGALRLSANPGAPSAAYLDLRGDDQPMVLTGVTSPDAERVELHETRREGGMTSMAAVESITVPADGEVVMAPGGLHLMIFGINERARAAGSIALAVRFADGTVVNTTATVAEMQSREGGAAATAHGDGEDHSGH